MSVKYRVAAVPAPKTVGLLSTGRHAAPEVPATVQVLDTKPGELSWRDKVKAYYHTLIVAVGSILSVLSAITLPGQAGEWVSTAVLIGTTVMTALTANEVWISEL
ncbi:hypothetical protein PP713_08730 [Mycobacterium sp. CSUR Q5927]|nr:hypothetical protein [Mycobacterium sp. CSUR Q5927]